MTSTVGCSTQQGLTAVPGLTVGHWTSRLSPTGCTVTLCDPTAVAGVDVRGSAPATREAHALATETHPAPAHLLVLGALAAGVVADAVVRAPRMATGIPGCAAAGDLS